MCLSDGEKDDRLPSCQFENVRAILNIWFTLWVFLTIFIMGTFFWSMMILFRQKQVWGAFAKRHQMIFTPNGFFRSPAMRGVVRGFVTTIFSEEQTTQDNRGRRFRTVVQIELPVGMPTEGVATSPELRTFADMMQLAQDVAPSIPDWNKNIVFKTTSVEKMTSFLTPERVKTLNAIMSSKGVNCIFVYNERETLLRFETADPLDQTEKIDRFVTKALESAKILSL